MTIVSPPRRLGGQAKRSLPETKPMMLLSLVFFLRVLGQMIVVRRRVSWLPPLEQWQSGLMPYPALLLSQTAILALQTSIEIQAHRGDGALVAPRPGIGRGLRRISLFYFGSMLFRYGYSMRRHPGRRWFGKTIPIVFHCVLATYLFLYSRLLTRSADKLTASADSRESI